MKNTIVITILVALLAGGGGFFGGMKYQQSKTPNFPARFSQDGQDLRGQFGQRAETQGLRPVSGTVISQDEDIITVESQDGSSKIILLTENSAINKTEQGSKDDLSEGSQVVVFGQENSDGSITAQNVQLNPPTQIRPSENQY